MPTANTLKSLHEELELLSHAIEGDTFHFVVAQWHHFSLIKQAENYLRQQFPERSALSLRVKGQTYETLTEQIYQQGKGFVFIEDFENLLDDPDLYVAFNQRRGKMARLPLSIIGFIPSGERFVEMCIKRLPDWWSVLTILAELNAEETGAEKHMTFQEAPKTTTFGGTEQQERLEEIQNLQKRISQVEITTENAKRLDGLYRQLLEICETAGFYQLGLDTANKWLEVAFALDYENIAPDTFSLVLDRIGTFEQYLGHYDRAAWLMEKALAIALQHFDPNDPEVAAHQSNLANVYLSLGKYTLARDLLEEAFASDLKNFGPDHPKVAVRQSNLANIYNFLGDSVRARDLLEAALASDLKNFGPEHLSVATRQSNLAYVYYSLGENDRARDLLETALASTLRHFGPEHPETAVRQSNLANIYIDLGNFARAQDLLEAALASDLKNLGSEHPSVAVRQSNLANVYLKLGEYDRARDLFEKARASDLKNLGPEHPEVAIRNLNLGVVFLKTGEKEKAKDLFQQAYDLFKKLLGEQHPNTQTAKRWLDSV